ncbi:hypothetical protein [Actinomycetospora termitidis]|uniref:Uncharacterized protein n=1 Tax=Actinomycetospora termitidis TaxID=3053470 RepID=A0ABT7MG73_9PSEU|nr:hypothetical protein [Actinomycetospora sp. Odt1-22]MDL5159446.1 hypothetical protein [Actinomycetospora sp. Odt1-22]
MTSREEQSALTGLSALLARDLTTADREELIAGVRQSELVLDEAPVWTGRLLEALHDTGMSWPEIERATQLPVGTAYRRFKQYREGRDAAG